MENDDFNSFLWRGSNYHGGAPEVFEDTHDASGNYVGAAAVKNAGEPTYSHSFFTPPPQKSAAPLPPYTPPKYTVPQQVNPGVAQKFEQPYKQTAAPLPDLTQFISPMLYGNIVLYSPRNASDVEKLIDYMKRREPAIIDLDPISDTDDAQRVLDFTSGAVYALGGRITEIKTNMFLITPEGVDVSKSSTDY